MGDITLITDSEKTSSKNTKPTNLFFNKWHLKFNLTKSAVVIFHSIQINKTENQLKIRNDIIKIDSQYKF